MAGIVMEFGSIATAGVLVNMFARAGLETSVLEAQGPTGAGKRTHIRTLLLDPAIATRWQRAHGGPPTEMGVDRPSAMFIPLHIEFLASCTALIPGANDTARALRCKGIRIGVNSSYSRSMLDVCLQEAARQEFVPESAVAATDVPRARP